MTDVTFFFYLLRLCRRFRNGSRCGSCCGSEDGTCDLLSIAYSDTDAIISSFKLYSTYSRHDTIVADDPREVLWSLAGSTDG
jgi:hypothetical protein